MFNLFRLVALLEGLSYILLLFIATPIKHFTENETFVKMLGMPHGILFISYIILCFLLKSERGWKGKGFVLVLVMALLPFGTFYAEKKKFNLS